MKSRIALLGLLVMLGVRVCLAAPQDRGQADPARALQALKDGNLRYVRGASWTSDYAKERAALRTRQHPFAAVLGCADSRVPPELIFDQSLGKLFVVRVAGNVAGPAECGSIEYAVAHLHVPLVVVLGHDNCGAVAAAVKGGEASPNLSTILEAIQPAVAQVRDRKRPMDDMLLEVARENVRHQLGVVSADPVVASAVSEHRLALAGAEYHPATGKVEWLGR